MSTFFLRPSPGGSAGIDPSAHTRIPKSGYIVFDVATGRETVYLVWSKKPVPQLERLKILPVVHSTVVVEDAAEALGAISDAAGSATLIGSVRSLDDVLGRVGYELRLVRSR